MVKRDHPGRHLASKAGRGVRARWCACRAPILRGMDDDTMALPATVDPQPLSPLGEAIARIQGRETYEMRRANGVYQLMRRNAWAITGRPPGTKTWAGLIDVLAEHACHSFPLPGQDTAHPKTEATQEDSHHDGTPPY